MLRLVTTVLFPFRELGDLGLSTAPPWAYCGISGHIVVRIRNDGEEAICQRLVTQMSTLPTIPLQSSRFYRVAWEVPI